MWRKNCLLLLMGIICLVHGQGEQSDKNNKICTLQTEILPSLNRPRTLSVSVQMDYKKEMQAELEKIQNKIIDRLEQVLTQTSVIALNQTSKENRVNLLLIHNEKDVQLISDLTQAVQITAGAMKFDGNFNLIRNENIPENCYEAMLNETSPDGVYVLKVPHSKHEAFGAYCKRFNNSGWTIIQRRQDGYVQFNTNWEDYKNGFGNLNAEYWIGLERLHAITAAREYELWIQLESYSGQTRFARYSKFAVSSEADRYRARVGEYEGDAGNSFGEANGRRFVTIDTDDDQECAKKCKSGWWHFCDFSNSNLNGEYQSFSGRMRDSSDHTAIYWKDWLTFQESLKYTHMAIRPV